MGPQDPGKSVSAEMLRLFIVVVALASSQAGDTKERIIKDINNFNNDVACWGRENTLNFQVALIKAMEQCSEYGDIGSLLGSVEPFRKVQKLWNNPVANLVRRGNLWKNFLASRNKRQAEGLLEYDEEEEITKFVQDFAYFKKDVASKVGNLTCVLTKMGMLDSSLQVNLQLYTSEIWEKMDLSTTLAGEDPVWRQHLVQGWTDCYQIAQNWPEGSWENNPLFKVFGRHMIFFKCAKKVEKKMCAAAQMNDWITTFYGADDGNHGVQLGLPLDKYKRAKMIVKIMTEQASDEEKFVNEFFIDSDI